MTATTRAKSRARLVPADYLRLARRFPLRPLRSDDEYQEAVQLLGALAVQPEGSLSPGEQDYLDALTLQAQACDDERFNLETADMSPLEVLRYLMKESGMRSADLGRLLGGNRSLASLILNGHRGLSKTHIRILAAHFHVDPSLLLAKA